MKNYPLYTVQGYMARFDELIAANPATEKVGRYGRPLDPLNPKSVKERRHRDYFTFKEVYDLIENELEEDYGCVMYRTYSAFLQARSRFIRSFYKNSHKKPYIP